MEEKRLTHARPVYPARRTSALLESPQVWMRVQTFQTSRGSSSCEALPGSDDSFWSVGMRCRDAREASDALGVLEDAIESHSMVVLELELTRKRLESDKSLGDLVDFDLIKFSDDARALCCNLDLRIL